MSLQNVEDRLQDLRADTGPNYHVVAWVAAVLLFGFGDVVTTVVGIELLGAVEGNALPAAALETWGIWVLVPFKLGALGAFALVYHYSPRLYRTGIPIGLAVLGAGVVGWNLGLLLVAAGVF